MRLVVDTNVLVSAALKEASWSANTLPPAAFVEAGYLHLPMFA